MSAQNLLNRFVGTEEFPIETGRYILYVSHSCPFAHRAIIARQLKGLEEAIPMVEMAPTLPASGIGWHFDDQFPDPFNGWKRLKEAYDLTFGRDYDGRVSEPVLWDQKSQTIISNESLEILRMVSEEFDALATKKIDFRPQESQVECDALTQQIAKDFAGAFYDAHFRSEGEEKQVIKNKLYQTAELLNERLKSNRFLMGDKLCEADLILFPALTRYEAVYSPLFGFDEKQLSDYPRLVAYMNDMAKSFDLIDTVRFEINIDSYFNSPALNPNEIKPPKGPLPVWM